MVRETACITTTAMAHSLTSRKAPASNTSTSAWGPSGATTITIACWTFSSPAQTVQSSTTTRATDASATSHGGAGFTILCGAAAQFGWILITTAGSTCTSCTTWIIPATLPTCALQRRNNTA